MLNDGEIEKVQKHFTNFKKEEEWLQRKLDKGWLLIKYNEDLEDGTIYTFGEIEKEAQKKLVYKIDFREFDEQEAYDEYIEVFTESGWRSLSKAKDGKHIFYSTSPNANKDIFSDVESFKEREMRVMNALLRNGFIYLAFLLLSIFIYMKYNQAFFIGAGLYAAFAMFKSFWGYINHRKTLKSIGAKTLQI